MYIVLAASLLAECSKTCHIHVIVATSFIALLLPVCCVQYLQCLLPTWYIYFLYMEEGFYKLVEVVHVLTYPSKDLHSHM